MKILKDNTHETYFTRCKWCCSEIEYEEEEAEIILGMNSEPNLNDSGD